jgi:hypothetical protein
MSEYNTPADFINLEEKRLVELMQKKAKTRNHGGLGDPLIMREAENKQAVANIFEKMREGKIPTNPVTAPDVVTNRLDENQKPGPQDNYGDDPPKPQKALPPTPPTKAEQLAGVEKQHNDGAITTKEYHNKKGSLQTEDFNLDVKFDEKIEEGKHDISTESLTNPKVKDIVSKLRAEAAKLRGEDVAQPDKPLVVKPADTPNGRLMENVEEPSYSLKKLNSMLYRAQDRFNQTDNPVYESIADELSSAIAEALLQNKKVVPKSKISGPARNF